jgi:LacI family transcriptional regulator
VSKITVSLALRRLPNVKASTAARILAVAEEMGYNPLTHDAARRLAARKTGHHVLTQTLGIVFPPNFHLSPLCVPIFQGIMQDAVPAGFALLTTYYNFASPQAFHQHPITPLPPHFTAGSVDGFILMDIHKDAAETMAYLERHAGPGGHPVVVVLGMHPNFSSVTLDRRQGGYDLTKHLLALGHRHLARYTHPQEAAAFADVLQGTRQALHEAGLNPDRHLHSLEMPASWIGCNPLESFRRLPELDGQQARLLQTLRAHPEITALMAWNDNSAIITCHLLKEAGLRIPDDVSVTGFDDMFPLLNPLGENVLTTVRLPFQEAGRQAARMLIDQVRRQDATPTHIILPTGLVPRQTTGPACPLSGARR